MVVWLGGEGGEKTGGVWMQGGVATLFLQCFRNHIYSILSRKDLLILLPKI